MIATPPVETLRIALIGVPNCGKTALFNRLTGSRQKVANYPGVTVERKEGVVFNAQHTRLYRVLDLPGTYSLSPTTLDEAIARDALLGRLAQEPVPDLIVNVLDATNLRLSLALTVELRRLDRPMVAVLNMSDLAVARGIGVDRAGLERELGCPVVATVAVRSDGARPLIETLDAQSQAAPTPGLPWQVPDRAQIEATQSEVRRILAAIGYRAALRSRALARLDALVMNPLLGPLLLTTLLFLIFQAVFSWAAAPMDWIDGGMGALGGLVGTLLPAGALQSLIVDGVIAGAGSVLVFLPQIVILFFFILLLEDSGYLPRAAFLLDRMMGGLGLSGRAFIPLLSSFACAIPGIMAARTIPDARDRLATIMLAPLMTCSARLPVYALIIGAFIPARSVGIFNLQGVVLFALYVAGILGAVLVALVMKRFTLRSSRQSLLMELPEYHWPNLRNLLMGLWERVSIFLSRVGTIILALMIVLWFLSSYPAAPADATGPAIQYSIAGILGRGLETIFAPIGFNWQISIALVPGLAAREVAVGALGTVYSLSAAADDVDVTLTPMIASTWSLATGLALLAWYVFAPQCLSTLATVKRETNSWRYPFIMAAYLFAMAYAAAFITYRLTLALS